MSSSAHQPPGKPPTEPAATQADIERTRQQLGDTVEALAYKLNMPARAKDRVQQTTETMQAKTGELKQQTQAKAAQVTQRLQHNAEAFQATTADVTAQARNLTHQATAKLPHSVRQQIGHLITAARQRPVPTAAVATVVMFPVLRHLLRRNR